MRNISHYISLVSVGLIAALYTGCSSTQSENASVEPQRVINSANTLPQHETIPAPVAAAPIDPSEEAWKSTEIAGTYNAFKEFLARYPDSSHASRAKSKLVVLEKEAARDMFRVSRATATTKKQPFNGGYRDVTKDGKRSLEAIIEEGSPRDGKQFIIVDWDLRDFTVATTEFKLGPSDLILVDESGQIGTGAGQNPYLDKSGRVKYTWASGITSTYRPGGRVKGSNLFSVGLGSTTNLKIRFLGKDYPLAVTQDLGLPRIDGK